MGRHRAGGVGMTPRMVAASTWNRRAATWACLAWTRGTRPKTRASTRTAPGGSAPALPALGQVLARQHAQAAPVQARRRRWLLLRPRWRCEAAGVACWSTRAQQSLGSVWNPQAVAGSRMVVVPRTPRVWVCHVEQGHYGHFSRKATWLIACGMQRANLPELNWARANNACLPG